MYCSTSAGHEHKLPHAGPHVNLFSVYAYGRSQRAHACICAHYGLVGGGNFGLGPAGACAAASARFRGALTGRAAVFRIAADRQRREAQVLLGEDFSGVACSDRWWAYDYLDAERRQLCWAHLVRDFTAHSEGLGAQKQFGAAGLRVAAGLFAAWEECRW